MEPKPQKKRPSRVVGIDYGMARIGLAISDERKIIAFPLMTLQAERKLERTIPKLMAELARHQKEQNYELEAIVVGHPLLLSGKTGLLADEVGLFVDMLRKTVTIPIVLWDERLTSVQADRALRETGMNRKKRSKLVDTVSAVILLQNYLDYKDFSMDCGALRL